MGNVIAVAKKTRAKTRLLPLRKSGPSSDMESAHRGAPSHPRSEVARACERACIAPCNLRVAKERALAQNAAVEEAICIAEHEEAEWQQGMAMHAEAVATVTATATAAAGAREAAATHERRAAEEAIAKKEAEVRDLEEALAREKAKKEAKERAHEEALARAQEDAFRKEAIEAMRKKVGEESGVRQGRHSVGTPPRIHPFKVWVKQVPTTFLARNPVPTMFLLHFPTINTCTLLLTCLHVFDAPGIILRLRVYVSRCHFLPFCAALFRTCQRRVAPAPVHILV